MVSNSFCTCWDGKSDQFRGSWGWVVCVCVCVCLFVANPEQGAITKDARASWAYFWDGLTKVREL